MSTEGPYIRVPNGVRELKYNEQGGICIMCGKLCKKHELTMHHIRGFAEGGSSTDPINLAGVCRPCHNEIERRKQYESFSEIVSSRGGIWPLPPVRLVMKRR